MKPPYNADGSLFLNLDFDPFKILFVDFDPKYIYLSNDTEYRLWTGKVTYYMEYKPFLWDWDKEDSGYLLSNYEHRKALENPHNNRMMVVLPEKTLPDNIMVVSLKPIIDAGMYQVDFSTIRIVSLW